MKHIAFICENDGSGLKAKVEQWKKENKEKEIVDIEYSENANVYYVTITYLD